MFVIFISDNLLTLGACAALFGKLKRTTDMFEMSLEIQRVGSFALGSLGELVGLLIHVFVCACVF